MRTLPAAVVALLLVVAGSRLSEAVHESTNVLVFQPPDGAATSVSGAGQITYNGGPADASQWTATFSFTGLRPDTTHVIAVRGRFGDDESADAAAFTPVCQFVSGPGGDGVCWDYFRVLRRLGVIEVREGDLAGPAVLRATRAEGPGTIGSTPNAFSPPPPSPRPGTPASATPAMVTTIDTGLDSLAATTLVGPGQQRPRPAFPYLA